MSIISYEQPEEIKNDPVSYEGKSYPYNLVSDHRRFEELIYSIYKIKIAQSEFQPYDTISLMNGVRDEGRDCVLLKNGRNYGLIQCKKYEKSLSKDLFGKEITKFALYSLLNPSLIYDRNQFEYYIAVTSGLANDCSSFIDEFKHRIAVETKLPSWIKDCLNAPTLAPLKVEDLTAKLIEILSAIKVKKILPADLDGLLAEPAVEHITPLFFKVRAVTDNSHIIELKNEIRRLVNKTLHKNEIKSELQKGSSSLRLQSNELEEIPDSHIDRPETAHLLNWIGNEPEKDKAGRDKNICLLVGDAGIGKTVILKDLYEELSEQNVPVLALKADKLYPANMQDLQAKINLSVPVFDFIEQCKQKFDTTVILIDQIDALSQSMSSDRNYLHVFRQLIDNFTYDNNVRIIISVRAFDLDYDPSLKIYKDIKRIKVDLLPEAAVETQLAKLQFPKDALSPKLMLLLRTPNNLNIFSIVYLKRTGPFSGITSIRELYSELWLQKIVNTANPIIQAEELKLLLYKITARMFAEQRISVGMQQFEDKHQELIYLESERILKVDGKQVQFFHQSFYDYVFARNFVESNGSLYSYIIDQRQSILIRSAVKMIVNYLRDYDHNRYVCELKGLLKSKRILFHIKHLLVSLLAVVEEPSNQEKKLFMEAICHSMKLKTVFLVHAYGSGWTAAIVKNGLLDFLIDQQVPKKNTLIRTLYLKHLQLRKRPEPKAENYLRHVGQQYLRNQMSEASDVIFDFVASIRDQDLLRWLAFTLDKWDDTRAVELFKRCDNFYEIDPFGYFHTLENMINDIPDFAYEQVKDLLFTEDYYKDDRLHDYYSEIKLVKELARKIPYVIAGQLLINLDAQINNDRYEEFDFNGDFKYKNVCLNEGKDVDNPGLLYKLLGSCLRQAAAENHKIFQKFIADFKNNVNESYLRLLIFAYDVDPNLYASNVSDLLNHLHEARMLYHEGKLNVEFRALFEKSFPHFTDHKKAKALALLKQLKIKKELYVFQRAEKKHYYMTWGLTKYFFLKRLPEQTIGKHKDLKRMYHELQRKFGNKADKTRYQSTIAQVLRSPLSQQAYIKMSPTHWISSFKKYKNDDHSWDDHLKGGLDEHSWAFKEYLAKNISKQNIELVATIIEDDDISSTYKVRALYGLTEANIDAKILFPLVERVIAKEQYQEDQSLFLSSLGFLFRYDCYNDNLVNFVINEAVNGETPDHWVKKGSNNKTSVNGLVMSAMNSCKGKAAEYLSYISDEKYRDRIFKVIDQLLEIGAPQVRAVIYYRYAYLMRADSERAFNMFVKHLNKEEDEEVMASSIWSLYYLANYDFDQLQPIFEKLIRIENIGDEDSRGISTIIFNSYLKGKATAKKLLTNFLIVNSKTHFWAVHEAFEQFYLFHDSTQKCLEILFFLLKIDRPDEDSDKLSFQLSNLENIKFADVKTLLEALINAKGFQLTEELTKYLTISCKDDPLDCVDLFTKAISKRKDPTKKDYIRDNDHATQFIIAGFSAIKGNDRKSITYRTKLLKTFDAILSDYRIRNRAELILDAV